MAYQGRKKCKTTNILLLTDRSGTVVACGNSVAGNHNDLYRIEEQIDEMLAQLEEMDIMVDGLFLNADSGFDAEKLRQKLDEKGVALNCPPNKRNGSRSETDILLDEEMYKERFVVEQANAWNDSFRTLLVRQDTTASSWQSWHFMAFICLFIKHRLKKP